MPQSPSRGEDSFAVVTLVQKRDFPAAQLSLNSIRSAIGKAHHFVLWNDEPDDQSSTLEYRDTTVINAGKNLGVAAGRNLLLRAAIDDGAKWIVVIDDDVLVPADYLKRAMQAVRDGLRTDRRMGMLAPVVLAFPVLATDGRMDDHDDHWEPVLESTKRLRKFLDSTYRGHVPPAAIDYMGIRGWERHYLSAHGPAAALARRFMMETGNESRSINGNLRSDPLAREKILDRDPLPIPVDTVPGGVAILSASMLEDVGLANESLGTFGYEDAELCIRARGRGYTVFVSPSMLAVHDIQRRGRQRDAHSIYAGRNRHRALLLDRHASRQLGQWLLELFVLGVPEAGDAVYRRSGSIDADAYFRLYLSTIAPFVHQWHLLRAETSLDSKRRPLSSTTNEWTVIEQRNGDAFSTLAEFQDTKGNLKQAHVQFWSTGPATDPSSLGWNVRIATRASSELTLEVSLEAAGTEDTEWRLSRIRCAWDVVPSELEAWRRLIGIGHAGWLSEIAGHVQGDSVEGQCDFRYHPPRPLAQIRLDEVT